MEYFDEALKAYEAKEYQRAYRLFSDDELNPKAFFNIAVMHLKGLGCQKDAQKAIEIFQKLSEQDDIQSNAILAHFYEKGTNVVQDNEKALEYYIKAANLGNVESQLKAGMIMRQHGDIAKAMQYLITAAHNNNEQAQNIITYVSNQGVSPVQNKAFRILKPEQQKLLINKMITEKIKPTLESDNGGIELINFISGKTPQIWLQYLGACSGCHLGSTSTADMLLDHFEELIDKNIVLYLM